MSQKRKAIVADALVGASAAVYLTELDETERAEALRNTGAFLTFNPSKELRPGEAKLLDGARLIQFMIGGVDFIPLSELPEGVPVATNGGGYAEAMAEHALAMATRRRQAAAVPPAACALVSAVIFSVNMRCVSD